MDWDGLAGAELQSSAEAGAADAPDGDSADAGDAEASCPTNAFCDSFERTALQGDWGSTEIVSGNNLALTDHAFAGAHALRTSLDSDEGARALLKKGCPASTSLQIRYQLFVPAAVTRATTITPITMFYSDRNEIVMVALDQGNIHLDEQEFASDGTQNYFGQPPESAPLRLNEWVEVIVDLSLGSTGHAKLTYGGTVVSDDDLARHYGANTFEATVGTNYAVKGDALTFDLDDFQVSWIPTH